MWNQISPRLNSVSKPVCISVLLSFSTCVGADFKAGMVAVKQGDWLTASIEFIQAADQGDPKAQTALCYMYAGEAPGLLKDNVKAVTWCQKAADKGVPQAEFVMGAHYDVGRWGVPENDELSVKWYRRAAERGYAPAQNSLGAQYFHGEGVPRDYAKMIPWYRKAAEQGYAGAQSNLGASYYNGQGVPRDVVLGYAWTLLGAAQDNPFARKNLGKFRKRLSTPHLAEAHRIAKELKEKIKTQKKPPSDMDSFSEDMMSEVCTPPSSSTKTFRIKMVAFTLPDGRNWCYRGIKSTQFTSQDDLTSYSFVSFEAAPLNIVTINLTNLKREEFADKNHFLKFAKKAELAENSFSSCTVRGKCKYKYFIEDKEKRMCVRFIRRFKRGRHLTGHGRLCVYSGTPSILLTVEHHTVTRKKPRGNRKKEILAQAEKFLNSIEFVAK